jgi:hypothetical protein
MEKTRTRILEDMEKKRLIREIKILDRKLKKHDRTTKRINIACKVAG